MRLEQLAAVRDRRVRAHQLQRSHGDLVTHQNGCTRLLRPLPWLTQSTGCFGGERNAKRHPEAKVAEGFVLLPRCQPLAELDDTDVAGEANDIGERERRRLVHVVDDAPVQLELTVVGVHDIGGAGPPLLEQ